MELWIRKKWSIEFYIIRKESQDTKITDINHNSNMENQDNFLKSAYIHVSKKNELATCTIALNHQSSLVFSSKAQAALHLRDIHMQAGQGLELGAEETKPALGNIVKICKYIIGGCTHKWPPSFSQ